MNKADMIKETRATIAAAKGFSAHYPSGRVVSQRWVSPPEPEWVAWLAVSFVGFTLHFEDYERESLEFFNAWLERVAVDLNEIG